MFNWNLKDMFGGMAQIDTYTLFDNWAIEKLRFIQRQFYGFMKRKYVQFSSLTILLESKRLAQHVFEYSKESHDSLLSYQNSYLLQLMLYNAN